MGGGSGFDRATALLERGNAAAAHTGFLCIASQGPGYEIAWHSAGMASLSMADAASPEAGVADGLRDRGLLELITAANAGWPASQAELAMAFAARGDEAGLERAAYWLAVLDANPRDLALGLERIPVARRVVIESSIGPDRLAAGEQEAGDFRLQPLERQESELSCQPWLVEARRPQGRGNGDGPRGGRGGRRGGGGGRRGPGG
ncbi:hypothetical protein [Hyphobacterium marinum]|uniref:Uncharacterized protein n=1 Tax=Hyphobacterium marinum TaxID=3116574 RepID=A0ABU7LVB8_9PROT|nr:hypothetical protein [Hyphobacterium sp. Y6023]MEE2565202.1 hypothetical protein [Hyphobacterium sp. Y6023]